MGTRWGRWFWHCATSQQVVGSIPGGSFGFFIDLIVLTAQPLTTMSTRSVSRAGKGGQCAGLTTLPPSCADCLEILAVC